MSEIRDMLRCEKIDKQKKTHIEHISLQRSYLNHNDGHKVNIYKARLKIMLSR